MVCRRSDKVLAGTKHVAVPLALTGTSLHKRTLVVVSRKSTTPVFTVLVLVVFDVKVTAWFVLDGFNEDMMVVEVAAAAVTVTSKDHPPAIVAPVPPELVSSSINKDHVPFTLAPLKPPNTLVNVPAPCVAAKTYGPAGAGGRKVSASRLYAVGLNVPDESPPLPGSGLAAASLSVMVTLLVGSKRPPTSEKNTYFCPPGPTSSISKSCVPAGIERLFKVRVTDETGPTKPETVIFD